ncbi:MAG: C10 family peptidase [Candidatus Amulumruptor caecigallinarius]|nr:C10 family peptidase [Candidatus Amulumruptor caecigallinarius]MCM1397327.1 C10 family peptidase [Candidatus Amulumruptor caecigallinarius]MCM1453609.1 C10 family peptidase [bacterium]
MKRILLSGAVAALALGATAESLTPQQALSRVYADPAKLGVRYTSAASSRLVDTAKLNGVTTYYVFSGNDQTLIVSADDVAAPLLGSFDSAVTDMNSIPDNMKWWLGEYSRRIAWAVEQGANSQNRLKVALKESTPREAGYHDVAPMIKTTWDQGTPYNLMCPTINNKRAYTGCVATAMAQVMYYHQWPQGSCSGTGSATSDENGGTYSMDFSGTTFDWANMLLSYSGSSTTTQKNAVALLMKACGYSVEMDYGTGASGAMSSNLVGGLINNFGYDKGISYTHRDFYSYDQWVDIIYTEMAAGRPVLYGGHGDSGGHQFVFDGFRASDKAFHINWGWGGASDGYFLVDALDPNSQGIGGNGGEGFNSGQDAVIGIQKPVSGSVAPEPYIMYYNDYILEVNAYDGNSIELGLGTYGRFANWSGRDFSSCTFGVRLVNADTKEVIGTYASSNMNNMALPDLAFWRNANNKYTYTVEGMPDLPDGIYDYYTVYRNGNGEWKDMLAPYGYATFVRIGIEGEKAYLYSSYADYNAFDYDGPETAEAGKSLEVKFTIENQDAVAGAVPLTAYLCVLSNGQYSISAQLGNEQIVDIEGGKSKEVTFSGIVDSSISSGTYYILLVTPEMAIINDDSCFPQITVSGGTDVVITNITYARSFQAAQSYRVTITMQNKGKQSATMQLLAALANESGSSIVTMLGQSANKTIAAGKTANFYITGTLADDIASGNYLFMVFDAATYKTLGYEEVTVTGSGAINDVAADGINAKAEYIDLSGRKVAGDAKGIVIRRTPGQKALKLAR